MQPSPQFDNPFAIADYLTEAFSKNDFAGILIALKTVVKAQNVKALSEVTGMRRDGLYKTFGGTGGLKDPNLSRLLRLFEALDVQITLKPVPPRKKPPRPKLGRPPKQKVPSPG
jgi:probable addiction module antidote protein